MLVQKLSDRPDADVDALFKDHSEEVEQRINCLNCANCCKTISPIIEPEEIPQLLQAMGIESGDLFEKYIEMDSDGDFVFKMQPCPMLELETNQCKIYENRPKACREFPHTRGKNMRLYSDLLSKNYDICPIVAEVVTQINLAVEE